ncbi:MAG: insulinase family protein [Nitrospirae bacterium]|nr:insulinase family protein [Nitrospirota bacterium]
MNKGLLKTSAAHLIVLGSVVEALAASPRTMTFPPVEFHPPPVERVVLDQGMVVHLLEDHELPRVRIQAIIRTGSAYEPADKIGLAGLTGMVMRSGGTASILGDALDEELEFTATEMRSMIGQDAGFASLDVLKKDFDRGLALFADMLMQPAFPNDKLDLAKQQVLEGIRRRNDHPGGIAGRKFTQAVYGADHPLARESTVETIGRITRDDLAAFHAAHYHPNAVILSVSGDFEKKEMIEKIRRVFAGWSTGSGDRPALPPIRDAFMPSVHLVEKDISQTHFRIGHLGIRQNDPDYFAVTLLDDILGSGGFRSRLFKEVRTRQGLAYSVGSAFTSGNLERGLFVAYGETKAQSTHRAITAVLQEINRIRTELMTEGDLRLAKDSFLNSFVFSFSNSAQIANRQSSLEYYGLPPDYLERLRDGVIGVTPQEIQRVAQKHLRPDGLIILAVGRSDRFDQPLSGFGKVNLISLEPSREAVGVSSPRD